MPRPIQLLTLIVPARYLIPSLTTLFLAGDLWPLFLRNISVLLGFGNDLDRARSAHHAQKDRLICSRVCAPS
jgi:hypothetical protein